MYFSVSVFFKSLHEDGTSNIWEDRIILLKADDESEAKKLAKEWAITEEVQYKTEDGIVSWQFVCIERIYPIESERLVTGVEIFSRFLKESEARSILEKIE